MAKLIRLIIASSFYTIGPHTEVNLLLRRLVAMGPNLVVLISLQVGVPDDFRVEPQPVHTETVEVKTSSSSSRSEGDSDLFFFPIFFFTHGSRSLVKSNSEAFEASKKKARHSNNTQRGRERCKQ